MLRTSPMDGASTSDDPQPEETRQSTVDEAEKKPESSGLDSGPVEPNPESLEALARAISSTLGGVITDFDSKSEAVSGSQDELGRSLDRLTAELDKLLEDAPLPFMMQHAAKIVALRKRVSALNSLLTSIQRRIDKIDLLISTSDPHCNT